MTASSEVAPTARGTADAPGLSAATHLLRAATALVALLCVVLTACGDQATSGPSLDRQLIAAAHRNDLPAARRLIGRGADVNAKDETEQSAYLIATSEVGDDPRLLELTLDNGADVDSRDSYDGTGLIRAAERGNARITARLLETRIAKDHVNRLGWTALLEAIILGEGGSAHVRTVRLLVDAGADVNISDRSGTSPLAHARKRGFAAIERILVDAGARR